MKIDEIIVVLKEKSDHVYRAGMTRVGINNAHALGIPIPELRKPATTNKKGS